MDATSTEDEVEPLDLPNVVSKCIALMPIVSVVLSKVEQPFYLIYEQKHCCREDLQDEAPNLNCKPSSNFLQHFMVFQVLITHTVVSKTPESIDRSNEVKEC